MKILIAGATGLTGRRLVRQLLDAGHQPVALVRDSSDTSVEEGDDPGGAAMVTKLFWATWHRDLGKLAMDVLGPDSEFAEGDSYQLSRLQRMYLFSRADTIYAGSNEIQRNIISERALGMPREPRPA